MVKGKSLSLLRAWVDDHTSGTFSCDREYSWDAVGGAIMFHEGRFIGLRIKFENGCYEVTGCDKKELNGVYNSQKEVINRVLIPLCNYAYKEVK